MRPGAKKNQKKHFDYAVIVCSYVDKKSLTVSLTKVMQIVVGQHGFIF